MLEPATGITQGYKMTELGPLPEDWDVVRLGDLANRSFGGGTPSTSRPEFWDGNIPWITSAVIDEDDIYLKRVQRYITEEAIQGSATRLASKGSVLIGTRVGVGKTAVTPYDVAINQDLTAIEPRETVLPDFLVLLLKTPGFQRWFDENKRGTTIKGVTRFDVLNLNIPLPPLAEQRAIAHVLHTVQQAREASERVIAAARQVKQSMMRHLFTYGPVPVEQAGKVPLKETEVGPVPEHWEVLNLEQVVDIRHYNDLIGNIFPWTVFQAKIMQSTTCFDDHIMNMCSPETKFIFRNTISLDTTDHMLNSYPYS